MPRVLPALPSDAVRRTRWLALVSAGALVLLCLLWELWLAPLRPGGSWLALKALPLLLALPGLWRYRLFTYRWTCLLLWLYVTEGLVRATSEPAPGALLAWLEVALALLLFGACVAHIRYRQRAGQTLKAQET
ncbi:MAG: DUF2069 domain-containing protein [Ottowia sp.]|nr:DUF2069 domain-containing protein [Ottowia sp.]